MVKTKLLFLISLSLMISIMPTAIASSKKGCGPGMRLNSTGNCVPLPRPIED